MLDLIEKIKDILGLNSKKLKLEIENLKKKNAEIEAVLTPELRDYLKLNQEIEISKGVFEKLKIDNDKLNDIIDRKQKAIKVFEDKILVPEETIELETFSLYNPRYNFINSDEYKLKLNSIRAKQKVLIKEKTAAIGGDKFTFNGSVAKGKQLIDNVKKNMLSTFNLECEIATNNVKFSNISNQERRIITAFEKTNKLGALFTVNIVQQYKNLKLEELYVAYEYQKKLEEEKEAKREEKERLREESRAAKELEEKRKELDKEKNHYLTALEKVKKQLENCKDDTQREVLEEKLRDIQTNIDEVQKGIADVDYRTANKRAGYVYIISNLGAFGDNVYKIGMTRRLDPMERVRELGDASVPFKFDVHSMIFSDDAPTLESALHKYFDSQKVNMINYRREFFETTLDEIENAVKENFDKTVEFVKVKEAEEYRESLKIKSCLPNSN